MAPPDINSEGSTSWIDPFTDDFTEISNASPASGFELETLKFKTLFWDNPTKEKRKNTIT